MVPWQIWQFKMLPQTGKSLCRLKKKRNIPSLDFRWDEHLVMMKVINLHLVKINILKYLKNQGSWGVEPEFETELCDLKIEGGTQGDLCSSCFSFCFLLLSFEMVEIRGGCLCWERRRQKRGCLWKILRRSFLFLFSFSILRRWSCHSHSSSHSLCHLRNLLPLMRASMMRAPMTRILW